MCTNLEIQFDDQRITQNEKEKYIVWAEDIAAEDFDEASDLMQKALSVEYDDDTLEKYVALFRDYINSLEPIGDDDLNAKEEQYAEIIRKLKDFKNVLNGYQSERSNEAKEECDIEIDRYQALYDWVKSEQKLEEFRATQEVYIYEYAAILKAVRNEYGSELHSINMVGDQNREAENKIEGIKEAFAYYIGSKSVAHWNIKTGGVSYSTVRVHKYDLYRVDLNERTVQKIGHEEIAENGDGFNNQDQGRVFSYEQYLDIEAVDTERSVIQTAFLQWFHEYTGETLNEDDLSVYIEGTYKYEGWSNIVYAWIFGIIGPDNQYYEILFSLDANNGQRRVECVNVSGGRLFAKGVIEEE